MFNIWIDYLDSYDEWIESDWDWFKCCFFVAVIGWLKWKTLINRKCWSAILLTALINTERITKLWMDDMVWYDNIWYMLWDYIIYGMVWMNEWMNEWCRWGSSAIFSRIGQIIYFSEWSPFASSQFSIYWIIGIRRSIELEICCLKCKLQLVSRYEL